MHFESPDRSDQSPSHIGQLHIEGQIFLLYTSMTGDEVLKRDKKMRKKSKPDLVNRKEHSGVLLYSCLRCIGLTQRCRE